MKIKHLRLSATGLMLIAAAVMGAAKDDAGFVRISPADVHWQDIPGAHGAQMARLLG